MAVARIGQGRFRRQGGTGVTKGDLTTTGTGWWNAAFVRLPTANGNNAPVQILGGSPAAVDAPPTTFDAHFLAYGGNNGATNPRKWYMYLNGASGISELLNTEDRYWHAQSAMSLGEAYFVAWGLRQIDGEWVFFRATAPVGGPAQSEIITDINIAWVSYPNIRDLNQVFFLNGTPQTPGGLHVEHVAVVRGDFPLDGSDGIDHAVVEGLASGLYRYDSPEVLAGGTILDWWGLTSKDDTVNRSGIAERSTVADSTGEAVTAPIIAPWADEAAISIRDRDNDWVFGGLGQVAPAFSGTVPEGVTALQFRVETVADSTAVPGLDWQAATGAVIADGEWTHMLPASPPVGGPYRVRYRDAADTDNATQTNTDWYVGYVLWIAGQSQMARFGDGSGVSKTAGSLTFRHQLSNRTAGGAPANPYVKPVPTYGAINNNSGSGYVALANAWWAATGIPLVICDAPVGGTSWSILAANGIQTSQMQWPLRGDGLTMPGDSDPGDSGLWTALGIAAERYIDGMLWCWGTSGVSEDEVTWNGHFDSIMTFCRETLFTASPDFTVWMAPFPRSNEIENFHMSMRTIQWNRARAGGANGDVRLLTWMFDWIMDGDGSAHPNVTNANGNQRGATRFGNALAQAVDPMVRSTGPQLVRAHFTDAARNVIRIETGRELTTIGGAALRQELWYVSTNSGGAWTAGGGEVAAAIDGTAIVLTRAEGSWPVGTTRVDFCRSTPYRSYDGMTEAIAAERMDGLPYDTHALIGMDRGQHVASVLGTGLAVDDVPADLGPRLVLTRPLPAGIYDVPIKAEAGGQSVTRTARVTVDAAQTVTAVEWAA